MTENVTKQLFIALFFIFISCQESTKESNTTTSKKDKIASQRVERIHHWKNKIDSLNKTLHWKELKANLWINKNEELGIKTAEGNEQGIDIVRYITDIGDHSLKSIIDTTSFEFLGSSFYKDKNHIYTHFMMSDGGAFWIVKEADVATFEIIGDCYAKDKNHIYGERAMVMDSVDYKTFTTKKGIGCFAKDKNGYYFWDEKIDLNEANDSIVKNSIKELEKI